MGVDWFSIAVWSLVGTWALVAATILLMYWQTRENQRLNSANAVMSLRERFDSARMRAARRHLADRLIRQAHQDIASVEVATFFELVGTLTHRRILEDDLVWEAFGTWVETYYRALRSPVDLIGQLRTTLADPLVYQEFEWLYGRICDLNEAHQGGPVPVPPNDQENVLSFLRREVALESI